MMMPSNLLRVVVRFLAILAICGASTPQALADEVTFYGSLSTIGFRALVDAIEKQVPGVKVTWIRAGGVGVYQRFVSERMAGKGKIDLLHTSYTPGWFHLAQERWVVPGVADFDEAKAFPEWAKDRKNHFVSLRVPTLQVIYNPKKVKPDEVPTSWKEFLTPKWKGRIVLPDPFEAAGVWDFFYGSKDFGEDYIVKLLGNGVLIQRAMGSSIERVTTGERDVTFAFEYLGIEVIRQGADVKFAKMQEGYPVIPAPLGVIEGGPNTETGKKVFTYLISKDGQTVMSQALGTYSGRADVAPPPGFPPLRELKLLHSDWAKVLKEQDRYRDLMTRNLRRK